MPQTGQRAKFRLRVMKRQLQLLLELQNEPEGLSVSDLTGRFGVEDATIYRDLQIFQEIGIKLTKERRGNKVFWRSEQFRGHEALQRQWRLIKTLRPLRAGATVAELAEELEVSGATVRRDIQVLLEAGIPLFKDYYENSNRWTVSGM